MFVVCLTENECKKCLNCLEIYARLLSVFIELGVPIIAKQANRCVITCHVASPQRGVAHIKEEFVSIEPCKKEKGESSGQQVTSICHSSLGCNPRGLIFCVMGWRCRGLQVKQLLMISLACWYGIFQIWYNEPALLCNRACCSSGVEKRQVYQLVHCHEP